MQTQSYVVKASIAQSMEPKIKGCQTLLMAMFAMEKRYDKGTNGGHSTNAGDL